MAENKKPKYAFLSRKMRDVIDHIEPRQMYQLLDAGCGTEFCFTAEAFVRLGIICPAIPLA
jgi:hypothetical protein